MRSKNSVNSSGDVPSPYFTPMLIIKSYISPVTSSIIIPFDFRYIFLIILISSDGICSPSVKTYHNFLRLILSYAHLRSMNSNPSSRFVFSAYWISVCTIKACLTVL